MKPAGSITDINIIRNISTIEKLKCAILSETARLFKSMNEHGDSDNKEILSRLLADVYLLADKIGISPNELDSSAIKQLKADMLSEKDEEPCSGEHNLLEHLRRNTQ